MNKAALHKKISALKSSLNYYRIFTKHLENDCDKLRDVNAAESASMQKAWDENIDEYQKLIRTQALEEAANLIEYECYDRDDAKRLSAMIRTLDSRLRSVRTEEY